MEGSVLVVFATRYGSTREIAEAVGAGLRESGIEAEVGRLREAPLPEAYRGVVIGAPLQMFKWHKDALHYIADNRQSLSRKPVAVFAVGPVTAEEREWEEARTQLDKGLARFPWFLPFEKRIFGGKFDPGDLRFPWTLMPGVKRWPPSDAREPKAVSAWVAQLAARFGAGEGQPDEMSSAPEAE